MPKLFTGRSHIYRKLVIALPTMAAMKAMKTKKAMRVMETYSVAAEMIGSTPKQVKEVAEALMALAAKEVKSAGSFNIAGAINIKLKKNPATAARKGVHSITKEPCEFKAKKASQKWQSIATKKFLLTLVYSELIFDMYFPIL